MKRHLGVPIESSPRGRTAQGGVLNWIAPLQWCRRPVRTWLAYGLLSVLVWCGVPLFARAMPASYGDGTTAWDSDNIVAAYEWHNRRGTDPVVAPPATLAQMWLGLQAADLYTQRGSRNAGNKGYQYAVPLLRLPGRGLDLALNLNYNSQVWIKGESRGPNTADIIFDADDDWPAPGWSLDFGRMFGAIGVGRIIVEPDGTKHNAQLGNTTQTTLDDGSISKT